MELRIRRVGSSLGVILPKGLLERLRVGEGDGLTVVETPDGVQLSPYSEKFAKTLERFRRVRGTYRDRLRELDR